MKKSLDVCAYSLPRLLVGLLLLVSSGLASAGFAQTPSSPADQKSQRERGLGVTSEAPGKKPSPEQAKTGTGRPELVLQTGNLAYGAMGVSFSPDGRLIAITSFNSSQIRLWETATGRQLRVLTGSTGGNYGDYLTGVSAVAFSRDSRLIAAGGRDSSIKVWDVKSGRELQAISGPSGSLASISGGITFLAFSPEAREIISFSDVIRTWDVSTGRELRALDTGLLPGLGMGAALSPDGRQLAAIAGPSANAKNGSVRIWDVVTGREVRTFEAPDDFQAVGYTFLSFTSDGRLLAAVLDYSTPNNVKFKLWDVTAKSRVRVLASFDKGYGLINFSPEGRLIALASGPTVRFWETSTGRELNALRVPNRYASYGVDANALSVAFSHDGGLLAGGGTDGQITVWETATGRTFQTLTSRSNVAYNVAFSSDGTRLLSGDRTIWDVSTGRGLRAFAPPRSTLGILSRDARTLATLSFVDNRINLYDMTKQRQLLTLAPAQKAVTHKAIFGQDGRILASTYRLDQDQI